MINVFMLAERLDGIAFAGTEAAIDAMPLRSVRLYSDDFDEYLSDCIYVLAATELGTALRRAPTSTFAAFGGAPGGSWRQAGGLLVLPGCGTAVDALARIDEVFQRFDKLEREMVSAAIAGRSATDVLGLCSSLLANPLVVSDSTFSLVGRSEPYDPERSDAVTDDFEAHGYVSGTLLPPERVREVEGGRTSSLYTVGTVRTLQTCIHFEGKPAGFIGTSEVAGPITEGQIALIWWINRVLEGIWPLITQTRHRQTMSEQVVQRIIDGKTVSETVQARALANLGWKKDGPFRLLSFWQAGSTFDEGEGASLVRALQRAFPRGVAIARADAAFVLVTGGACDARPSDYLLKVMVRGALTCTASMTFCAFGGLQRACRQCEIARLMASGEDAQPGAVLAFEDAALPYLLGLLERDQALEALVHPRVSALAAQNNGVELVHSLRLYLACGQNMARAARALYVHRSTLAYRIELVEKALDIPLKEVDESRAMHLYLSCVIVEERGR